jgi:hypothetical protein
MKSVQSSPDFGLPPSPVFRIPIRIAPEVVQPSFGRGRLLANSFHSWVVLVDAILG